MWDAIYICAHRIVHDTFQPGQLHSKVVNVVQFRLIESARYHSEYSQNNEQCQKRNNTNSSLCVVHMLGAITTNITTNNKLHNETELCMHTILIKISYAETYKM